MSDLEDDRSKDLLARFARGDKKAFDELYEKHATALRGFLRTVMKTNDDDRIDEASQRVWTAVIAAAKSYRPDAPVRSWLAGIARNVCHEVGRGRARDRRARAFEAEPVARGDESARNTAVADVRATLATLSPEEREVLLLRHAEGRTFAEIAAATRVSVGTVQDRLRRAIQRIRPRLVSWTPRRNERGQDL